MYHCSTVQWMHYVNRLFLPLLIKCLYFCRASGWSEEPAGVEPHHDHPERALGARRGPSEGVQSHLCSRRWRSWEHGRTGRTIIRFLSAGALQLNLKPNYSSFKSLKSSCTLKHVPPSLSLSYHVTNPHAAAPHPDISDLFVVSCETKFTH